MNNNYRLMYKVATLYYKYNLTQQSIARKLDISKYKVSRILKSAKIRGVVKIMIIEGVDFDKKSK